MKKVLVTYSTYSGSTADVAAAIGEELAKAPAQVDVRPMAGVESIDDYDAIVAGGPMIMGWHRPARGFLHKHRRGLAKIPFAVFVTAMSLTETGTSVIEGVPVVVDERLPRPPAQPGHLTFKERYARTEGYLRPILRSVRPARPISLGLFGGRLEYGRLKWYAVLFVMVLLKVPAGDRRNWDAIRAWAATLRAHLDLD
jgi:menaquinone-dependent protoporphyrinogen oxidase